VCAGGFAKGDISGDVILEKAVAGGAGVCCQMCQDNVQCRSWAWKAHTTLCFLQSGAGRINLNTSQPVVHGTAHAPPPPPPPPPVPPIPAAPTGALNVLMIAVDDMRPEMTPYGHVHMHTPHMQALADRSMLFTRAYVQVRCSWAQQRSPQSN